MRLRRILICSFLSILSRKQHGWDLKLNINGSLSHIVSYTLKMQQLTSQIDELTRRETDPLLGTDQTEYPGRLFVELAIATCNDTTNVLLGSLLRQLHSTKSNTEVRVGLLWQWRASQVRVGVGLVSASYVEREIRITLHYNTTRIKCCVYQYTLMIVSLIANRYTRPISDQNKTQII